MWVLLLVVIISCEGATDSIYFPYFQGYWDIELDGMLHMLSEQSVASYIRANLSRILDADNGGFMGIENLDNVPHRFKLIPKNGWATTYYTPPTNNPTFTEHENGSLTFCLAPA